MSVRVRRVALLAAIRGVRGEYREARQRMFAQRSRFLPNARLALVLDVGDATIDRVNQFPKVTFQRCLCELGIREVDHRTLGQESSAAPTPPVSQSAQSGEAPVHS
jgi:hypothetical protein